MIEVNLLLQRIYLAAMIIEDIKEKCKALGVLMKVQTNEEYEFDDTMASAVNVVKIDIESYTAKACIR